MRTCAAPKFILTGKVKHVQTNIQQAPGARVPTVREQGLLAVQLSGQRGGMQRALDSHADLRLC